MTRTSRAGRTAPSAPTTSGMARWQRIPPGDVYIGVLLGLLAGSNLVQSLWLARLPWLDLTSTSFALILLAVLGQLVRLRFIRPNLQFVALLVFAVAIGFHAEGMNPGATEKRVEIVPGVLLALVAGYLLMANLARVKVFAGTLVAQAYLVAAAMLVSPDSALVQTYDRLTPSGLNPIASGRILSAGALILVCVGVQRVRSRSGKIALLLAVPLMVAASATGSRGPLAAALAAALLVGLRTTRVSLPGLVGVIASLAVVAKVLEGVQGEGGSRLTEFTDSVRANLLAQSARIALDHPLGVGWGNLYNYLPPWAAVQIQRYNQYPHNVFVEFLVEGGWIAGILVLIFAVAVIKHSWSFAAVPTASILSALSVFSLGSSLFSSDVVGNRMLWVVAGAALAMTTQTMGVRGGTDRGTTAETTSLGAWRARAGDHVVRS